MKIILLIIAVMVGATSLYQYQRSKEKGIQQDIQAHTSTNGFVDLTFNLVGDSGIVILAPVNCPSQEAQRADKLAAELKEKGIPFKRTNGYNFRQEIPAGFTKEDLKQINTRMKQILNKPAPLVFIDGKAKSDPSLQEVLAEYRGRK